MEAATDALAKAVGMPARDAISPLKRLAEGQAGRPWGARSTTRMSGVRLEVVTETLG